MRGAAWQRWPAGGRLRVISAERAGGWRGGKDAAIQQLSGAPERQDSAARSLRAEEERTDLDGFSGRIKFSVEK